MTLNVTLRIEPVEQIDAPPSTNNDFRAEMRDINNERLASWHVDESLVPHCTLITYMLEVAFEEGKNVRSKELCKLLNVRSMS